MPIRQPSSEDRLFDWWRAALADPRHPRHEEEPQCGFFRRRAVKGGPWLPVEIRMRQVIDEDTGELAEPETLEAFELGRRLDPAWVWTSCRPIGREDYDALVERHRTIREMEATHAVLDLSANPMLPGV